MEAVVVDLEEEDKVIVNRHLMKLGNQRECRDFTDKIRWEPDNPHPFSQMKTELIWWGNMTSMGTGEWWISPVAACRFRRSKRFMRQIRAACATRLRRGHYN